MYMCMGMYMCVCVCMCVCFEPTPLYLFSFSPTRFPLPYVSVEEQQTKIIKQDEGKKGRGGRGGKRGRQCGFSNENVIKFSRKLERQKKKKNIKGFFSLFSSLSLLFPLKSKLIKKKSKKKKSNQLYCTEHTYAYHDYRRSRKAGEWGGFSMGRNKGEGVTTTKGKMQRFLEREKKRWAAGACIIVERKMAAGALYFFFNECGCGCVWAI